MNETLDKKVLEVAAAHGLAERIHSVCIGQKTTGTWVVRLSVRAATSDDVPISITLSFSKYYRSTYATIERPRFRDEKICFSKGCFYHTSGTVREWLAPFNGFVNDLRACLEPTIQAF
jgi:hypothetical protein